jgi:hypothetical protein
MDGCAGSCRLDVPSCRQNPAAAAAALLIGREAGKAEQRQGLIAGPQVPSKACASGILQGGEWSPDLVGQVDDGGQGQQAAGGRGRDALAERPVV